MLPLMLNEPATPVASQLLREDSEVSVWWGTWVECAVAISRTRREGRTDGEGEGNARSVLDLLSETWFEIEPSDDLRLLASLLSRDHPLKAADALQLAAALRWCEGDTGGAGFVCLDKKLRRAASEEGFDVLPGESF